MTDSMIASVLTLSRKDAKELKIVDDYSIHRVVYDLFSDERSDVEKKSQSKGFLYADKDWGKDGRKILMLSNRQPNLPEQGRLEMKKISDSFLDYQHYRFEVVINPTKREKETGKIKAIHAPKLENDDKTNRLEITRQMVEEWFIKKSSLWGFQVSREHLEIPEITVKSFMAKEGREMTLSCAKIVGILEVTDKAQFIKSFQQGIGRGKAFGCGLLQIVPLQ